MDTVAEDSLVSGVPWNWRALLPDHDIYRARTLPRCPRSVTMVLSSYPIS